MGSEYDGYFRAMGIFYTVKVVTDLIKISFHKIYDRVDETCNGNEEKAQM
jgi:hypothetical protein